MENKTLDGNYWNERYVEQDTGWDIGSVSTPLKEYIDQLTNKDLSILVPGCGNAYEAEYLLKNGFTNITLVDISPEAVKNTRERLKAYDQLNADIRCIDFFELDKKVDLVIEQTFFCALDPALRTNYVAKMYELLNPGGKLVGVLFNRSFEESPPFGGSKEEYELLFSGKFNIQKMELCYNSIEKRKGNELFVILKKV